MNNPNRKIDLLLPYAYDNEENEVHISDAIKGQKYFCPVCGEELILRLSKIPEGEKYHRKNHFAHKIGSVNNCTESYLHKRAKQKLVNLISESINSKSKELIFGWHCEECGEYHKGNLLKKAIKVVEEYDLGTCRPDIALLDNEGRVVIVIEIIVTHKPDLEVLSFYRDNNIVCLQLVVHDFDESEDILQKLLSVDEVNKCPNPICPTCGQRMNHAKMFFIDASCWRCNSNIRFALIRSARGENVDSTGFNKNEIELANQHGANIKDVRTKDRRTAFYSVCNKCLGYNFTSFNLERLYDSEVETIDLGKKCFHCVWKRNPQSISFFR